MQLIQLILQAQSYSQTKWTKKYLDFNFFVKKDQIDRLSNQINNLAFNFP